MAIVSLRSQRITVYDAKGWILRAPVSSGTKGRETPAGIFSVIQNVLLDRFPYTGAHRRILPEFMM